MCGMVYRRDWQAEIDSSCPCNAHAIGGVSAPLTGCVRSLIRDQPTPLFTHVYEFIIYSSNQNE